MNKNHVSLATVHTHTHTRIPSSEKRCQSMIPQEQENGIIISATEPVRNRRKIWIRKGKNLYNPETMPLMNGLWYLNYDIIVNSSGWYVIVPIIGGRTYTVSKKNSKTNYSNLSFALMTTEDYPSYNAEVLNYSLGITSLTENSITADSNANYLFIGLATGSTLTNDEKAKAIEELQVEQISSKTSYEEHVEPAIFIKNENGNYDEFSQKKEVIKKQYTFKGLSFNVLKHDRTVEITIGGATDEALNVNTFYDLQLDDIFKPLVQVEDNITLSVSEAGMIRVTPDGVFRIYPWRNLNSGKGFRYNISYISAY